MKENYIRKRVNINNKEISFFIDYDNKDIYMSQSELATLFNTSTNNIGLLIRRGNLTNNNQTTNNLSVVQTIIPVSQSEGKNLVKRNIKHYNLKVIKEIGYKLNPNLLNELLNKLESIFNNNSNNEIIDNSLNKAINNYEIVQFVDGSFKLDVNVSPSESTVWLSLEQISNLYERDISTISRHIKNILDEKECDKSNLQKMQFANSTKPITLYDLDMIISIGFRVNSKRGLLFRIWAKKTLKQLLLNGYSYDEKRCLECNSSIVLLHNEVKELKDNVETLKSLLFINNDIKFEGDEILEAYGLIRKIFYLAKIKLIIIDPYADKFLISLLNNIKIDINIYTSSKSLIKDERLNDNIKLIIKDNIHSRIIISDNLIFSITHSFNGLGKSEIIISRLKDVSINDLIN